MTVISPALSLPTRLAIVAGRAAEELTERGLDVRNATLNWRVGADTGPLPVTFHAKPGGYYALQLDPTRDYPDFSGVGTMTLDLTLTLRDGAVAFLQADVPDVDLIPAARVQPIAGRDYTVFHLPGAPVTMNLARDPAPVMLEALVLVNSDPGAPGVGLNVTVGGTGPFVTDADGRFRTGLLPLTTTVAVRITDGTDTTDHTQPLDFTTALNRATYSFEPEED